MNNFYLTLFITTINFIIQISNTINCIYNPNNFTVTADFPINQYLNCLEYCEEYYSKTPQRAYYNITTKKCEPRRRCPNPYYHYPTNKCYTNANYTTEDYSYYPLIWDGGYVIIGDTADFNCLNGIALKENGLFGAFRCECYLLWDHSGQFDMNGLPFKCDKASTNLTEHFKGQIIQSSNGTIIKYGPFSPIEVEIMVKNQKAQEEAYLKQYAINQTEPIIYAVDNFLAKENFIRDEEYIYIFCFFGVSMGLLSISYWEQEKMRVKISESKLKKRIMEALNEQNLMRNIG